MSARFPVRSAPLRVRFSSYHSVLHRSFPRRFPTLARAPSSSSLYPLLRVEALYYFSVGGKNALVVENLRAKGSPEYFIGRYKVKCEKTCPKINFTNLTPFTPFEIFLLPSNVIFHRRILKFRIARIFDDNISLSFSFLHIM